MRKNFIRLGMLALAGSTLALGCQSGPKGYPSGPLLASKQPVAGKSGSASPTQVADAEPKAPQMPATALAALPANHDRPAALGLPTGSVRPSETSAEAAPAAPSPFRTAGRQRGPVIATPAVRSSEGGNDAPVGPALERKVSGHFGHCENYTWLQGVLEKHYKGYYTLRYSDPSMEDQHGGTVCLGKDPLLNQFKDGDVIYVEGTLSTEKDPTRHEGWQHHPQFHVRTARRVDPKDQN